jgi:hypothetical protein
MRQRSDGCARAGIVASFILAGILLTADGAGAGNLLLVPISWCAHGGSNAATGLIPIPQPYPNTQPDTATDAILWRRHERVTDSIFANQATITLRSAITNPFDPNRSIRFPVIPDQTTGPGTAQLGDVVGDFSSGFDTATLRTVWDQCRAAWQTQFNRSDGIHAVNINRFVDGGGPGMFSGASSGISTRRGLPSTQAAGSSSTTLGVSTPSTTIRFPSTRPTPPTSCWATSSGTPSASPTGATLAR